MYKNKIIIGLLIFILVALIGVMVFLFLTKDNVVKDIAKTDEEDEDIYMEENTDIMMAEKLIFDKPFEDEEIAIMEIKDYGKIKIKFFPDTAPKAVENFKGLAQNGYYKNVTFHRVIKDFMIQGGDPTGTGNGGESYFGSEFGPEYEDGFFPYRGTLCMASVPGIENSLSSQFFIVQAGPDVAREEYVKNMPESIKKVYMEKGGTPHLYKEHTVFGFVYEGMNIIDKIAKTKTNENDKPLKDVIIKNVKIEKAKE